MAVAAWALLTLQDAKEHLQIESNEFDTVVEAMVDSATLLCESECDRELMSRTHTNEVYNGTGSSALKLRQYPVSSVTKVEFLTTPAPETWTEYYGSTAGTTTYPLVIEQPVSEVIRFRNLYFPGCVQSIRVTYVAGLTSVPKALRDAAKLALKAIWDARDKQNANIASQSFPGGQTVVYDRRALPELFHLLLEPYKRCAWV